MPVVVPEPLGGLATELGSVTQRLQAREADRLQPAAMIGGPASTITSTGTFESISGWDSLDVSVNSGGVYIVYGFQWLDNNTALLNNFVDTSPAITSGNGDVYTVWFNGPGTTGEWFTFSQSCFYDPSNAPLGRQTFAIQACIVDIMSPYPTSISVRNPFLIVVPL